MLGIIFTGGEAPDTKFIKNLIEAQTQAQKDTLIIAADSGLIAAQNAGVNPDWVIGDMDSIDTQSRLAALPQDRIIRLEHDKDFTDTEMAFSLALEKGCRQIWIIGGGLGRIDHIFGIRSLFEREVFPLRWITSAEDIHCLDANSGQNELFITQKKGALVSVFPLGDGPWEAQSIGLKWQLDGLKWNRGFFGLSNTASENSFSITAKHGRFMVILTL
ncbi:MAG: thiamine diphosphokinase [Treponema sp.]|nr:thiamine diphosphokinase [Treponema sp.]